MVLANVPSFRFSFRGNIRRNHPFGNHPFVNTKKGSLGDKRAVSKRVVLANVPSFRFSFRGNIRRNHPFGNHPFANPRDLGDAENRLGVVSPHLPGEIFPSFSVGFSRFFPRFQSVLVNFSRLFPRFQSILVSFSQF